MKRSFLSLALLSALGAVAFGAPANAQSLTPQPVLVGIRSNETVTLRTINWVTMSDCESHLVSVDAIDVLEGPSEVKVAFKPRKVLAFTGTCRKEVDGGDLVAIASNFTQKAEAPLVFRVTLTTKSGPQQLTQSYRLLMFP